MFNEIKSVFQKPENGFDPVPSTYAKNYAEKVYMDFSTEIFKDLCYFPSAMSGLSVIDLGAGPGQYSIYFAKQGAKVTWYDISNNYLSIARYYATKADVELEYKIGYLDHAQGSYDFVFNRVCWCYSFDDFSFARLINSLIKPNGYGLLVIDNEKFFIHKLDSFSNSKRFLLKTQFWLNEKLNIKIGHPHPSHKKIQLVLSSFKFKHIVFHLHDYRTIVEIVK